MDDFEVFENMQIYQQLYNCDNTDDPEKKTCLGKGFKSKNCWERHKVFQFLIECDNIVNNFCLILELCMW